MKPSGAWSGKGVNPLKNNLGKESYVGGKFGLLIAWLKEFKLHHCLLVPTYLSYVWLKPFGTILMHVFFSCLPFLFCLCNMWGIVGVGVCSKHFYYYLFSSR